MPLPQVEVLSTTSNPFPAVIEQLRAVTFSTPTPGLAVRLGVLVGVTICCLVTSLTLLTLNTITHLRTPDSPLWLFRRVHTPEGSWIVTNLKLTVALFGIIVSCVDLTYLLELRKVYLWQIPSNHIGVLVMVIYESVLAWKNSKELHTLIGKLNVLGGQWSSGTVRPDAMQDVNAGVSTLNAHFAYYERYIFIP
ncbi:hypothetical protein RQP46_000969 [Phenoliferia psychrophenolica]